MSARSRPCADSVQCISPRSGYRLEPRDDFLLRSRAVLEAKQRPSGLFQPFIDVKEEIFRSPLRDEGFNREQGGQARFPFLGDVSLRNTASQGCPIPATRAGAPKVRQGPNAKSFGSSQLLCLRTSRAKRARAPRRCYARSSAKPRPPPKFFRCSAPVPSWLTGGNEAAIGAASHTEKETEP